MAKSKVLIVVEGAKQEPRLVRALLRAYDLDTDYEVYSYNTNVHELYERMFVDDDPEALSLLSVLKSRARPKDKYLFDADYSDVLLMFDYDPQDNRFDPDGLERMARYFDDSTDEGKLYLNYPMVEACRDFRSADDVDYLNRTIRLADIPSYKSRVGNASPFQNFDRDFAAPALDFLIALTAAKACAIAGLAAGPIDAYRLLPQLDHGAVLRSQNRRMAETAEIWVLGACLLFPAEYSRELVHLKESLEHLFGTANTTT